VTGGGRSSPIHLRRVGEQVSLNRELRHSGRDVSGMSDDLRTDRVLPVKDHAAWMKSTLEEVAQGRNANLSQLIVLSEAYPDLKAKQNKWPSA
jgi:hypothetical protein